jgi:dipeptidyl aminopeptidase/acylaminoacyl peptidase
MKRSILFYIVLLTTSPSLAQMIYQSPDKAISDLIESPGFSHPFFNRQRTDYIRYRIQSTPSIEFMARPNLRLAGMRLNADNLAQVSSDYRENLSFVNAKNGQEKRLNFPKWSYVQNLSWSPNGKYLAVTVEAAKCVELWIVNIPSLKKSKVPSMCLNATFDEMAEMHWLSEDQLLVNRRTFLKEVIISKVTPQGPVVRESGGVVAQNRTYQDLLKTPQDAEAFANATQGQMAIVDVRTLKYRNFGDKGVYSSLAVSPNREWVIVTQLEEPFLFTVPYYLFKRKRMLWSLNGKVKKSLGLVGPFENIPIEGVPTGPRNLEWDPTHPQRFIYAEALDGGDWKNKVPHRDQLVLNTILNAKGDIQSDVITKMEFRFEGVSWLEDSKYGFFVQDYERDSKQIRYFQIKPVSNNKYEAKEFLRRNENDDYSNPGSVYRDRNEFDRLVGAIQKSKDGDFVYWTGEGASPDGNRPFVKKMNLADFKMTEVFRSPAERFERFIDFSDRNFRTALFRSQSPTDPPQYEIRKDDLSMPGKALFIDENPYKTMSQIKRKILKYKRKDGIELSGTLYYPLGYKEGEKYPAVVSAYPLEYTDAKSAGQTRAVVSNYAVPLRTSPLFFALHGYAVLDNAQIPIVGHPETKNDTFIEQLTDNAEATVKALEQTGFVDVKRIGVIGHSYGAFMVSHLLTHTKFFAAGIARSGAYNRTLTPFGFQGERRPLWEAKSTYLKLSSFLDAEKMKFPLLMIHGMDDNNPGTFTLQSERYFDALKGQGAQVRLVLLPTEMHGYAAQESVKHVLWESFSWFDKYLASKKP